MCERHARSNVRRRPGYEFLAVDGKAGDAYEASSFEESLALYQQTGGLQSRRLAEGYRCQRGFRPLPDARTRPLCLSSSRIAGEERLWYCSFMVEEVCYARRKGHYS